MRFPDILDPKIIETALHEKDSIWYVHNDRAAASLCKMSTELIDYEAVL